MDEKTNVMRILDQKKVKYTEYTYLNTDAIGGQEVAEALGEDANKVFKTLVTVGKTGNHYVFLVPVNKELNLKKAAKAVGEKKVEMKLRVSRQRLRHVSANLNISLTMLRLLTA
jgi:Cys-tRNA(Pro)/Cys-tRNA(Cys) deacylase